MNLCRYFMFDQGVWKFEPDSPPLVKTPESEGWADSWFESLEQFLADPTEAHEITAAEAERLWIGNS